MPAAAAVKGILISISIITALSVAVLENPQVQAWLEQQRQKIAELLRSIGEELDPQSRRAAEAFAFEGRTPATDESLRREVCGSQEAAAIATGRSLSTASTIRRIPVKGPSDPDEAEERRRKGREYLAQRNQQMIELKERRKSSKGKERAESIPEPLSPTSFDSIVDADGKLKSPEAEIEIEKALPSVPTEAIPEHVQAEMREVEKQLEMPLSVAQQVSTTGWSFGSLLANPFSDEYALDRSETPKPPVPPKEPLEMDDEPRTPTLASSSSNRQADPEMLDMPGSFTPYQQEPAQQLSDEAYEDLSFEEQEQLAIAFSLSEAEAEAERRASQQSDMDEDDAALKAAIEASLKDTVQEIGERAPPPSLIQPLIDLTPPDTQPTILHHPTPRGHWETFFDQNYSPTEEPLSMATHPTQPEEEEDELYRVTPNLTRARLATHNAEQAFAHPPSSDTLSIPYDPVREAASAQQQQDVAEASFYSAVSSAHSPATTHTMDYEPTPQLVDVSETVSPNRAEARTPYSAASFGFQTDDEADSETFASISAGPSAAPSEAPSIAPSRSQSRPRSEISNIEVIDLLEDSDVDMMSEEGDGHLTPDSWTEVESEVEDEGHPHPTTS